jgi:hypothetical protein
MSASELEFESEAVQMLLFSGVRTTCRGCYGAFGGFYASNHSESNAKDKDRDRTNSLVNETGHGILESQVGCRTCFLNCGKYT